MDDLSAFQRDTLYAVASLGEPYGLAIRDELSEYYEAEVNHGRLYPNLDKLAERGYLNKRRHDERKNTYSLTEAGRELLVARHEWEADCLLQRSPPTPEPTP